MYCSNHRLMVIVTCDATFENKINRPWTHQSGGMLLTRFLIIIEFSVSGAQTLWRVSTSSQWRVITSTQWHNYDINNWWLHALDLTTNTNRILSVLFRAELHQYTCLGCQVRNTLSLRIRLASCMSLGISVTRLAWIAHSCASLNRWTRNASEA